MKVLFAVNSESISDAIIKKYQRDYREILSYKNVYYFNAIQKEIQKDKTYDRIVISADLEPFSSNNYESIDKFIFEKLDGISDEAHDTQGNEISIILICSDRHTKGSSFLVKLFGLGIYNALLGNDRSMEEVCRLIHKPRTKKEAKMYYKIDTDDVNYRTESENEVDELQIQNILYHFRKLGKNTEKYASSFENIASQYTEEQLKIIINCLPANVKRVLEETSAKYQDILRASGIFVQGVQNNEVANKEDQKRTGVKIDIIENKLNQSKINGPIVIPNSVKSAELERAKKIISMPPRNEAMGGREAQMDRPKQAEATQTRVVRPERRTVNPAENHLAETPKQPEKIEKLGNLDWPEMDYFTTAETKKATPADLIEDISEEVATVAQPKRGRGRPRKNPVQEEKPKGKRGRPRKNSIEEPKLVPEQEELVDLEEVTPKSLDFDSLEEDNILLGLEEKTENHVLEDLLAEDDEMILNPEKPKPVNVGIEDELEEIELPELDDLEDITDLDEDEEDMFSQITEESFDEFEDYDEFGKYETTPSVSQNKEDIDELYKQDILLDEQDDLLDEKMSTELPGLQEEEFEEFDVLNDDSFDMDFEEIEDNEEAEEPVDNKLLTDLEDDELDRNLLDLEAEEEKLIPENDELNHVLEGNSTQEEYAPVDSNYGTEAIQSIESPIDYSMSNLNSLMTKDKKIVTFLGSTKNGVSFLVNNLAEIFASVGINTAILDMTQNRNSYYIYTQNEEALRQIAYTSIEKLQEGVANGIRVKQNLTVYTALPNDGKDYSRVEDILSTLVQNHSLILVDCDFDTNPAYFASCQEIYLVQSMDILTIQPLTAFLRDLKTQGVFEPEKVRVVINKELKVRGLTNKAIIGGMSSYNDPAMSFMTELFDKENVKYCSIPFEEMAYSKYLEGMLNCKVSISGYSKNFMNKLRVLGDMVYPLTSRQTYSSKSKQNFGQNNFSGSMNDTLNKMKKNY